MNLSKEQQIAMLVVPILFFGVLGLSSATAFDGDQSDDDRDTVEKTDELKARNDLGDTNATQSSAAAQRNKEAIRNAVLLGDFAAFKTATTDTPFGDLMTEEAFNVLVQAHDLYRSGDTEAANAYLKQHSAAWPMLPEKIPEGEA